jgi:hypothetical protein
MQSHMASHVDTARSEMFQESCDDVRNRLLDMCKQVEEGMSLQTDEIFMRMQRDYTEVVSGTQLPQGQMMPRQERKMRSDVSQTIEDFEKELAEAQLAAEAAKLAVEEEQKNLADSAQEEFLNSDNAVSNDNRDTNVREPARKVDNEPTPEDSEGSRWLSFADDEDVHQEIVEGQYF